MWNKQAIERFRRKLVGWYGLHRRELPWRNNITPYRIWISEIMLQQTQTKTVVPYFERFLKRFPDIESLAKASEPEILKFWSGLGYYSRARNIHRAARQILATDGFFPQEFSSVLALPGIGKYTAGAICSIALNQPYPIVDGNIRRVLTRLNGITGHVTEKYFWDLMSGLVPRSNPSIFNQAMMELGALVCVPGRPNCMDCPVQGLCRAKKLRIETSIPAIRKRLPGRKLTIVFLVLELNRRVPLSKACKGDLIPGAWKIPWQALTEGETPEEVASSLCRAIIGGAAVPLEPCEPVRHSIMNNQITGLVFFGHVSSVYSGKGFHWMNRNSIRKFLTSSLYYKVLDRAKKKDRLCDSGIPSQPVHCPSGAN